MTAYEYVITSTRVTHNGSWNVSALVDGMLFHRTYYGFTRTEAVAEFREVIRRAGYGAWKGTVA